MQIKHFSTKIKVFRGRQAPEEATLVGYGAIIEALQLAIPLPEQLALISDKRRKYSNKHWKVFSSRAAFDDNLYKHLVFALKYEGVNLLFFKKLFSKITEKEVMDLLQLEPTGQYSRKIWFLYEWLEQKQLKIKDLTTKSYVPLVDDKIQYTVKGERSSRHNIINNMPGTIDFCPLIRKTEKLEQFISSNYAEKKEDYLKGLRKDLLQRASAFLLLKDSKASFTIEGERPKSKRAVRWGQAIGQAGSVDQSKEELLRLQQIVIENDRFVNMGFRNQGGFVGEHDRLSGEPIPDHISAKWEDLDRLVNGLIETNEKLLKCDFDAVLSATLIAFGFVFIHPFADGNGRIHRYLIHHVLAKKKFSQQGMIFPVSASILDHITDYREVLESYSHPILDFVDWQETKDHNVEVLNETIDYYRFFDATKQAEFMCDRVRDTIENIIPSEVAYLIKYEKFKKYMDDDYEMPDKMVASLVRFLERGGGELSKRGRNKEFSELTEEEVEEVERVYREVFQNDEL